MSHHYSDVKIESDTGDIFLSYNYLNYNRYGYLCAVCNIDDLHVLRNNKVYGVNKILLIGTFHVQEEFRGLGIGSALLTRLVDYAKENNVKKIILDDMTDNCRQANNIYLKHGFNYLYEYGPEMELLIL
jgi:GNAT superfamily N-acetyltransferase